jgi:isopentenyl-diphosphate delta-isomerase
MANRPTIQSRKSDHIRINLEEDVKSALTTGLEKYRFIHQALPGINLEDVNLSVQLFGKVARLPLLISSMTGGTSQAASLNRVLATAAHETGVALGIGSQRAMLEHPETTDSFRIRKLAPGILLFANLGAVQLNYGYTIDHCRKAVDLIEADGLILHLNPLQEALQPEGDTRFAGLLDKIERICHDLPVPVIAKEVGWGISTGAARQLTEAGVSAIDVAGAGGTSWSQVEMYRVGNESLAQVAAAFRNWGIPTAESIQVVREAAPTLPVIASGGLRDGIDAAKCIALGATLCGMAGPFLKAASEGIDPLLSKIDLIRRQLQICMFSSGAGDINQLQVTPLQKISE